MERMTDQRLAQCRQVLRDGHLLTETKQHELLDALMAERAEVARLEVDYLRVCQYLTSINELDARAKALKTEVVRLAELLHEQCEPAPDPRGLRETLERLP
jgi:uncharacterized small protein (DUF1192 family)